MPGAKTSLPSTRLEERRKRGAQKGNQNARKHGFYSRTLGQAEACEFWNITSREGIDAETAVLRVKLQSVITRDPGNRRVLGEAAKVLTKWLSARYRLGRAESNCLKRVVRAALEPDLDRKAQNSAFLQNESNVT